MVFSARKKFQENLHEQSNDMLYVRVSARGSHTLNHDKTEEKKNAKLFFFGRLKVCKVCEPK